MSSVERLFLQKKETILKSLAAPEDTYTDLSPKGSIDIGIRDLIDLINSIDGAVTTSSCSGRISVFQEGHKTSEKDLGQEASSQTSAPGGKGRGGTWLFVSHDPVPQDGGYDSFMKMFQLLDGDRDVAAGSLQMRPLGASTRFVRFQFEPMILHIMTASLETAHTVLSAAMAAGMRESGLQSLRSLKTPHSFPMVAVRSVGLALSSVIGYFDEIHGAPRSLVDEVYLNTMITLGNARFVENTSRIARFKAALEPYNLSTKPREDKSTRAERKRIEGLERQAATRSTFASDRNALERHEQDAQGFSPDYHTFSSDALVGTRP